MWNQIVNLSLTRNMRLLINKDSGAAVFANNVIMLGDGNIANTMDNTIKLPVGKMFSNSIIFKIMYDFKNIKIKNDYLKDVFWHQ